MKITHSHNFLKLLTVSVLIFLYFPIITIILYSFQESSSSFHLFKGLTLKWYQQVFHDRNTMLAIQNTFIVALISSVSSTILGFIGAYAIYTSKQKLKKTLLAINNIPIINPDLITGVSLFMLFMFIQFSLGLQTMIISHIAFSVPYAILMIYPKFSGIPANTIEAGYDLGATEWQVLLKIILPEVKMACVGALLICFTLSIDDFIVSFFTTGSSVNNLSTIVYSVAKRGSRPFVNALASLVFFAVFTLLFIINKKFNLTKLNNNL